MLTLIDTWQIGPRPLFVEAARFDIDTRVLKAMVERGADINAQEDSFAILWPDYCTTALMYSSKFGNVPSVRFLLSHHANVAIKDRQGHTALYHAMHPLGSYPDSLEAKQIISLLRQAGAR